MSSKAVIGLAYGDCGKGSITDWMVRQTGSRLVVRFNGGPQASHHVVLPDGRSHGFSQFGSGTFAGARTYLSEHMMIEPYALENEARALLKTWGPGVYSQLSIHYGCPVITPWHWRLNRLRESRRGENAHGTCGMGIGELRADMEAKRKVFRVGDKGSIRLLQEIREQKAEEARSLGGLSAMADILDPQYTPSNVNDTYKRVLSSFDRCWEMDTRNAIFEGTQGFLLDQTYGFQPHTTWSDCTQAQALMVADDDVETIGVLPLVYTRHGAGPFVTEDPALKARENDHNKENLWQGAFRRGHFDLVAAKYALSITGIQKVVLTMADQFTGRICYEYRTDGLSWVRLRRDTSSRVIEQAEPIYQDGASIEEVIEMLDAMGVQVVAVSRGPTWADKTTVGSMEVA